MDHFPIFLTLTKRRIIVAGGGGAALAKLRLAMKTSARIEVFALRALPEIAALAEAGRLSLIPRALQPGDAKGAALVYVASGDMGEDARLAAIARADAALVNVVDTPEACDFLTPAIVDRDPLVVAIGTEGTAPVLARSVKAGLEARLTPTLGTLARIAGAFRAKAEQLPEGRARRAFWSAFFDEDGPRALERGGPEVAEQALHNLLSRHLAATPTRGRVDLVGAGPGDPELLTLRARRLLDRADVVIHDRLVAPEILDLARREAKLIAAGKQGFGPAIAQQEINALMVEHAARGAHVVRLKGGDPAIFARLDEEIAALDAPGIDWAVVPGITAASAAAAALGQGLTRRGRNGALRLLTGHDVAGFAEHDWRGLARPGTVAAIYMGKRAARFLQGRLLMHGAAGDTPVTLVENAARPDQRIHPCRLSTLPQTTAGIEGPAVLLYGLSPRAARTRLPELNEALS